jgi:hypothetical protein
MPSRLEIHKRFSEKSRRDLVSDSVRRLERRLLEAEGKWNWLVSTLSLPENRVYIEKVGPQFVRLIDGFVESWRAHHREFDRDGCPKCGGTGVMKGDENADPQSITSLDVPCPECQEI